MGYVSDSKQIPTWITTFIGIALAFIASIGAALYLISMPGPSISNVEIYLALLFLMLLPVWVIVPKILERKNINRWVTRIYDHVRPLGFVLQDGVITGTRNGIALTLFVEIYTVGTRGGGTVTLTIITPNTKHKNKDLTFYDEQVLAGEIGSELTHEISEKQIDTTVDDAEIVIHMKLFEKTFVRDLESHMNTIMALSKKI